MTDEEIRQALLAGYRIDAECEEDLFPVFDRLEKLGFSVKMIRDFWKKNPGKYQDHYVGYFSENTISTWGVPGKKPSIAMSDLFYEPDITMTDAEFESAFAELIS